MDIKIIEQKENPLLERDLIIAEIGFDKTTPNRQEVKEKIAAKVGGNKDLLIVRNIKTKFGKTEAVVKAYLYKTKEAMEKIETKEMLKRNAEKSKEEGEQ